MLDSEAKVRGQYSAFILYYNFAKVFSVLGTFALGSSVASCMNVCGFVKAYSVWEHLFHKKIYMRLHLNLYHLQCFIVDFIIQAWLK